ncbi:GNAT family N-acetyltransferase [Fusobacterium necrophorum]|uniref:GNAT family N-acetyltransferase n=1 Tax=Fusobacterium necrophorum TaxID=859 RepID=A0A4Q2L553_9FUSO|nr:GNAT family N-acetyltransferase [Fusobacterium necrophorum]RXZ71543.1 GNAT family N-acetyltransferase [Fusobacterium necrophorum]
MQIRKAKLEDLDSLANIHSLTWQAAYKHIFSDTLLKSLRQDNKFLERKEKFKKDIEKNSSIDIFLLETFFNGKMEKVGFLVLSSLKLQKRNNHIAEIIALYILPEFWGQGFGKVMMEFSIERFQRFHAKEIILWVLKDNKRARSFYKKFGFVSTGEERELPIEHVPEIEYKLIIKN